MISLLKGWFLGGKDYVTLVMSFRKETLEIHNLDTDNCDPYLGAKLDKESAIKLRNWLDLVIEQNKHCDKCWNYEMPSNFTGQIKCSDCGYIINQKGNP